ncbi:MAG: hypothetical protein AB1391_03920 [Candidatus Micrarchaeota archaeon]
MVEGTYFPTNINKMEHSEEYYKLKEQLDRLNSKVNAWIGNFDLRLRKLEGNGGAKNISAGFGKGTKKEAKGKSSSLAKRVLKKIKFLK